MNRTFEVKTQWGEIVVTVAEGSGVIDYSNFKKLLTKKTADLVEAIILGHACAGIDVSAPAYILGLDTALEGLSNNA